MKMRLWDDKRVPAKTMDIIGLDTLIQKIIRLITAFRLCLFGKLRRITNYGLIYSLQEPDACFSVDVP